MVAFLLSPSLSPLVLERSNRGPPRLRLPQGRNPHLLQRASSSSSSRPPADPPSVLPGGSRLAFVSSSPFSSLHSNGMEQATALLSARPRRATSAETRVTSYVLLRPSDPMRNADTRVQSRECPQNPAGGAGGYGAGAGGYGGAAVGGQQCYKVRFVARSSVGGS